MNDQLYRIKALRVAFRKNFTPQHKLRRDNFFIRFLSLFQNCASSRYHAIFLVCHQQGWAVSLLVDVFSDTYSAINDAETRPAKHERKTVLSEALL